MAETISGIEISGQSNRISGLAERQHFYFLIHNAEIEEFRKKHNLPYSDNSYFDENGNLVNQPLTEEELKEYNFLKKYEISLYPPNQIVIDTDKDVKNDLEQKGVYRYNLSGAGFNSNCQSKFVGTWKKTSIEDILYIKDDFTWRRKKQINEILYYLWEGKYTFGENIVIFSLTRNGSKIIEKEEDKEDIKLFDENLDKNLIKFYGLMTYIDSYERIYTVFKDIAENDLTNFYIKSDPNNNGDKIEPGARGELKRGIINLENKNIVDYILGSNSNNGNSTLKIYDDRKSLADIIESKGGEEKDDYFDDRFGRDGGNVVINSFDFYEKHEAKDGHLSIEFLHFYFSAEIKPLKIIVDNGFKEIPDTNIKFINYGNPTETYYQITSKNKFYFTVERNKEIDIDNSFLFDSKNPERKYYINSPNPVEKYPLKKIRSLSIECLDNCKRILSFDLPFVVNEEYTLDLKTKDRDFYIAICRNDKINKIIINNGDEDGDKEFKIEDEDENGINRKFSFTAGQNIEIKLTLKEEYHSLMNVLTEHYIRKHIDPAFGSINNSSNKLQKINFTMPEKDVFLPLIIENYYTLKIKRDEYQYKLEDELVKKIEECHFKDANNENDLYLNIDENNSKAFVNGDVIDIYVKFIDTRKKLDSYYLYGQIIPITYRQPGDMTNLLSKPTFINDDNRYYWQYFQIKMPPRDTTLYLKWIKRYFTFEVSFNKLSSYTTYKITSEYGPNSQGVFTGYLELYYGDHLDLTFNLDDFTTVKINESYFKINDGESKYFPKTDNEHFGFCFENSQIKINSDIINENIFISLELEFPLNYEKLIENYNFGTIQLTEGKYLIIIKGASGEIGGSGYESGQPREKGCGYHFIVEINNIVELNYRIGENGYKGKDGESFSNIDNDSGIPIIGGGSSSMLVGTTAGAGGGGGGSSLLSFSSEVDNLTDGSKIKAVFCNGGVGGKGGDGFLYYHSDSTNVAITYEGGRGGEGGNSEQNKNGKGEKGRFPKYIDPTIIFWIDENNFAAHYPNRETAANFSEDASARGGMGHNYYNFIENTKSSNAPNGIIKIIENNNNFDLNSIRNKIDDSSFENIRISETGYFYIKRIE